MKRSYQSLTIKKKLEIIDRVESLPPGKKKKDIAAEYEIPCSTLSTILKDKDKLRENHCFGSSKKKRQRNPTQGDVDEALFQWFTAARAQSVPISGEVLKSKAEELCKEMEPDTEWKCSSGWLSRWKVRHNISYKSICGENAAVDKEVCADWMERVLRPILTKYKSEDVFNADETGLFWRLLPDKTHAVSGEVCTGGKLSKERITVLVCANMSGTEKMPLITIGKFKRPRCFRGVDHLPLDYDANKNAWMTSVLFEAWLRKWDSQLFRKGRKIALIIDNCTAHPHIPDLVAIELVFLPPNTTSEMQPCDQGIIKMLKVYYRKSMVKRLIHTIDCGKTLADLKITLLDALQMLRTAWELVTPIAITNCFRKAGFFTEPDSSQVGNHDDRVTPNDFEDDGHEMSLESLNLEIPCTFEDFVLCDANVDCSPMPTNEDIIGSIIHTDIDEDEEDDLGDELPTVTYQEACSAFSTVRAYLLHSSTNSEAPYSLLQTLEFEISKCHTSLLVQPKITDYFSRL